jgi:hypothetical protein
MRFRLITLVLAATGSLVSTPAHTATVKVEPDAVWIERGRGQQFVAADFVFTNERPDTLELTYVEVSALDAGGRLLSRRFIGANGTAPSIQTIAKRQVLNRVPLLVFNPFPDWDAALPIATLRYRFELESVARAETLFAEVRPRAFEQKTKLMFPLAGRVFVFDAHDALAHHRRLDTSFEPIAKLGLTHNSGRYAYDLSLVDEKGSMWRTDGKRNPDWWSWGVPVRAPAAGRVAKAYGDRPDWEVGRTGLELDAIMADPTTLFGNSVVIDHGNGEFSMLAHMKQGSVLVKQGDVVRAGQTIGAVGYSGSVFTVHLHYELRTGVGLDVEGLPSRFEQVDRWIGGKRVPEKDGFITTGDIVESR